MKYSKKKIVSVIFLSLISLSLFINLFSIKGKSALADITYDLNKEVLYTDNSFDYDYSFNLDNSITTYSENYSATYSFENEIGLTSEAISWVDDDQSTGNCEMIIIDNLINHNTVMKVLDFNEAVTLAVGRHSLNDITYGTLELWVLTTNAFADNTIPFFHGASGLFFIRIHEDKVQYYDGVWKDTGFVPLDNQWYHLRIDFECTGGAYEGLAQYDYRIYINGILYGDYNFWNNNPHLDTLGFQTATADLNYDFFIDAIGYSWDANYTISENILPISEISSEISQISAYEFVFENIDDKYEIGETNPETWFNTFTGGGNSDIFYDYSSLIPTGTFYRDRVVRMDNLGISTTELSKDNIGITSNFINVTIGLNISLYDINADMIYIQMEADPNDLIDLRIYKTGGSIRLTYFDGGHTLLYDGLNLNDIYEFNILLNLELDQAFIILNENSINIGNFQIPFKNTNEIELDTILFYIESTVGNRIIMDVDYVGIFDNGITAIELDASYGYTQIKFNTNWNFRNHNLFTLRATGLIQPINFISADNIVYPSEAADDKLDIFREYTNNTRLNNIYEIEQLFGANTSGYHDLILYTKHNITYEYINIEGVSLSQESNKYWLKQSYSGINSNESYFYVDDNEKLQFIHIANDTNLEYIQAEFNIADVSSDDFAIKFISDIDNKGDGYFRVKFTDISNFIPIPIYETTTRVFISQNKTISSFIILITDDDIDTIQGSTTGYIREIELLFVTGIGVSVTTSNILEMMIPIIIIFIPTFLLSSRTGKNTIVPIMMLMTIVCAVTDIIPYWLLFIIILPSSLFLFLKRKEGLF